MIRFVFIALMIVGVYYVIKKIIPSSGYINCGKCDGKGYWIATRGDKDKCDACGGSGKVFRNRKGR